MKSLKKQRRIQMILVAVVALVLATGLIGYAMRDGINLFRAPSQVMAEPPAPTEVFRLGGLVKEGSLIDDVGQRFFFVLTDGGADVPVHYIGNDLAPDLFEEKQGAIAIGSYVNGVFEATRILAKHDENYMPSEIVDALKEQGIYQEPGDS